MTRPRTPTGIIAARGGLDAPDRAAKREGEPAIVGEIGEAPDYFDELQKYCWKDLRESLHANTTGDSDRFALEMAALLLARMRRAPYAFDAASMTRLHAILGSFGMTPADRSKLKLPSAEKAGGGFAGIIGSKPGLKAVG